MNATVGIAYVEFQNVSIGTVSSYLPLLQLALSCILQTAIRIRWIIEKTGSSHTLYDDITLPQTNLTDCTNAIWPIYPKNPISPYSVGVNYEITTLTPDIFAMSLLLFNTLIANANQTHSVASLMGSPYFFSAAPVQLLHLSSAKYTQLPSSTAESITLFMGTILFTVALIVQSIV